MQAIALRPPRDGDEGPLESLIVDHFSPGSEYDVDLGLDDPNRDVRIAEDTDGTPLGVMALDVYEDSAAVADAMHMFDDPTILPDADRYGLLNMGYVADDATGRGVGSRLLERLEAIAVDRNVALLVADSWYHGGDDSPEHLFDRHGYETIHRDPIEDRTAADCPKCEAVCTCEAAIAARWIDEGATN